jgi:nuclease S1
MTVAANKKVSAAGFRAGNLHHFWDTEFVNQLETSPQSITSDLIGHISKTQEKEWQAGKPSDWAKESFQVAKDDAYGQLPEPTRRGTFRLTDEYVTTATDDVAQQLSKAGVRLAFVLNKALGR